MSDDDYYRIYNDIYDRADAYPPTGETYVVPAIESSSDTPISRPENPYVTPTF